MLTVWGFTVGIYARGRCEIVKVYMEVNGRRVDEGEWHAKRGMAREQMM